MTAKDVDISSPLKYLESCSACNAILGVIYAIIDVLLIETIKQIYVKVYSSSWASRLSNTLFLHYKSTTSYRLVDSFEYTYVCTQRVMPITKVFHTEPILVARPQYGTATG